MKTAAEKVFNFMHRNHSTVIYPLSSTQQEELNASLILLLKEQDRDTRHACAEAVNSSQLVVSQCPTVDYCVGFNKACTDAHDVCMNVQAL